MTQQRPNVPKTTLRRKRGFQAAGTLVAAHLRGPAEKRGFAEAKLLTHWEEIVGPDTARIASPVKIRHTHRDGFGGTLVLLTTGAQAPIVEMQKDQIRTRVNACYGYNAISRVQITQTAPTGFAEGQAQFRAAPAAERPLSPETLRAAEAAADGVGDPGLKAALERLARNILTKSSI